MTDPIAAARAQNAAYQASYRKRHGDSYRKAHSSYMQKWRSKRKEREQKGKKSVLSKMSNKFILNEQGVPIPENDVVKWGEWFQSADRRVAFDEIGCSRISTVFLGLDHQFGDGEPILWETLVFGGELEGEMDRCSGTAEDAKLMHARMVLRAKEVEDTEHKRHIREMDRVLYGASPLQVLENMDQESRNQERARIARDAKEDQARIERCDEKQV